MTNETNETKEYVPRPPETAEARNARKQKQAEEAEAAVRDYFAQEQHRLANMKRLRELREKGTPAGAK